MSTIDNIINNRDFDKKLSIIYLQYKKETGKKISYEGFIKLLQRRVFLWLRDILGIKLDLPNKFFTFRNDVINPGSDYYIAGRFCSRIDQKKLFLIKRFKLIKIHQFKIGAVVDRDILIINFIGVVGHEMAHYYNLANFKLIENNTHGIRFQFIVKQWNHVLKKKGYNIKILVKANPPLAIINPKELSNCYLE